MKRIELFSKSFKKCGADETRTTDLLICCLSRYPLDHGDMVENCSNWFNIKYVSGHKGSNSRNSPVKVRAGVVVL